MRIGYAAAAIICCVALSGCAGGASPTPQTQRTVFVMDTAASVKGTEADVKVAVDTLGELDGLFDRYDPESDIYAINKRLDNADISDYTAEFIRQAARLGGIYGDKVSILAGDITDVWNISGNDPVVPSDKAIAKALESYRNASFSLDTLSFADENGSIDPGCAAKGYALDKIEEKLGEDCCIVSLTSSILLHGEKQDGERFSVSLRDPSNAEKSLGKIYTGECFLSTSGGYERFFEVGGKRYIHIFDLSSGTPCETDLTSVTVISGINTESGGILSDFLSTLIFIEGTEGLGKYMSDPQLGIVAVSDQNVIYTSVNVDLTLAEDCEYTLEVWENG